jgi:four helix bundle protein
MIKYVLIIKRAKMTTIKNFEDLAIWKMARVIVNQIYDDFRNCRDFGFRDQITRSGISIMNNISEGFCRGSDAEFRRFLNISKGSAGEIKNMYYIAEDQLYISTDEALLRRNKSQQLINSIGSFNRYLKPKSK